MQPSFIRMPKMSSHIFIKYICEYKEKRRKNKKTACILLETVI